MTNDNQPKLSPEQIRELRKKRSNGKTVEALAEEYEISRVSVYNYLGNFKMTNRLYQESFQPETKTMNMLEMFLYGKNRASK